MHGAIGRRLPAAVGVLLSTATIGLMSAPAQATTTDTWTGANVDPGWSNTSNWDSGAPTTGDFLVFQGLASCDTAVDACYDTTNDNGPLNISGMSIDAAYPYELTGSDAVTITTSGGYGINASPSTSGYNQPLVSLPIILGNAQSWLVSGGSAGDTLQVNNVSDGGNGYGLTLRLNNGNMLVNTVSTGLLTTAMTGNLYAFNLGNTGATLPSAGVDITQSSTLWIESPGATSGPITADGSSNGLDLFNGVNPESQLTVNGDVTLNGAALGFAIDGPDTTAGLDSSELLAGNVDLGGAALFLDQGNDGNSCDTLTADKTYTLLSASGTLSGALTINGADGSTSTLSSGQTSSVPIAVNNDCTQTSAPNALAYITYGAKTITATVAGAPTSSVAPTISGTAQVGQTLTAGNGTWTAYPAPIYTYVWNECTSGSCTPISGATSSTFAVTSAQEGHTIEVQVTATNAIGNGVATSSATGTVPTPQVTTTTTTTTTTPAPTLPTAGQVSTALAGIGHPTGSKAIAALIKTKTFTTGFAAPSAGSVKVVWTTVVITGTGKHKKHRRVTVATGSGTAGAAGRISVRIHLTVAGRALLKRTPHNLHITATERFQPTGGSWTTLVRHFTL